MCTHVYLIFLKFIVTDLLTHNGDFTDAQQIKTEVNNNRYVT